MAKVGNVGEEDGPYVATDILDKANIKSLIQAGKKEEKSLIKADDETKVSDAASLLEVFAMTEDYVNNLGKEVFVYKNLIIKGHIVTIIAMSGGGKTTIMFFEVCPALAQSGCIVWYIDADSPASDHKKMKEVADRYGFKLLNPDVNAGTTMDGLVKTLRTIADSHADLTNYVFVVDTLKKAADLMSKGSVKGFYQLARKLSNLGATVILLGHANKYRDKEGNLVFEGVGDIRSDSDELIYFERRSNVNDGIDVTTVIDPDKGAKVRGIFQPISFHVSESREVTQYKDSLPLIDRTATANIKATDDEIIEAAKTYLFKVGRPVLQKQLVQHIADLKGAGQKRVRKVIVQHSEYKDASHYKGMPLVFSTGDKNAHHYELPNNTK